MVLSGIIAADKTIYWNNIRTMLGVVMFLFILVRFTWVSPRYIYYFYLLYILKFFYIFFYAYQHGLFAVDTESERFNLDELNANVFGYFGFFALSGVFLLITFTKSVHRNIHRILFCIVFIMIVVAGILAASRATLLVCVLTFIVLLMVNYLYPFSKRSIIFIVITALTVFLLYKNFQNAFENSLIGNRFEAKEDSRYSLITKAIEIGEQHPFFGVGAGNFAFFNAERVFSHNAFTEVWANNGAVGLILYLMFLFEFFKNIRQYLRLGGQKKIAFYFGIIWAAYCIYNFFYVFYEYFFLPGFIFVVAIHMAKLRQQLLINIKNKYSLSEPPTDDMIETIN
jgi:O-antigen ligase